MVATSEVRRTVLVVDDNEANRTLARMSLENEGYDVEIATSGEEALRMFEEHRPDCIVLDIKMPGLDGTKVCATIRQSKVGADVPILFLTASRDVDTFDKAIRAGGDDFLTKPIQPVELAIRVEAAMKMHRLGAELRQQFDLVRHQRDAMMRLQLQKEELTAFIVHDLKNPVNAIDLHAQLAIRNPDLPDAARDSLLHIRSEARALARMIVNLLDVSRADEERLRPTIATVDLAGMLPAIFESLQVKATSASVTLESSLEATKVTADAALLRRTLENLVENALRFAPKKSSVVVSTARVGDEVEFRVRDFGRGVPPEMHEKVFERYTQAEDRKLMSSANRGLGLAFCKLAVEAHGGTIRVEDGAPGAVFCFVLPNAP
jgi:two-component system, sensor histidine kinase and response regulator